MENFTPEFKENDDTQFVFINKTWKQCSEERIESLWRRWVSHKEAHNYRDEYGFTIYGYKKTDTN